MMTTIAEIRARWEKASAGPWHWSGNTKTRQLYLSRWVGGMGRVTVMAFTRWGMQDAQPEFIDDPADPFFVNPASEMAIWEVAPEATDPADRRLYRHDVSGIRHPDAEAIAAAPADVAQLLGVVARLEDLADWHDTKADKARRFPGNGQEQLMEKAAQVHEQAAARIRDALKAGRL